jgi:hypothetical protein
LAESRATVLEQHDPSSSSGPYQIIGGLLAILAALTGYISKLKAKMGKQSKIPPFVELRSIISELLDIRIEDLKHDLALKVESLVQANLRHENLTDERFKSLERRMENIEYRRTEDRGEVLDRLKTLEQAVRELSQRK